MENENYQDDEEFEEAPVEPQSTWFSKMGDAIQWKVIVPNLHNPYELPIPDRVLVDLSQSDVARRKVCDLRCLCDGYEVLSVKNIQAPQLFTSHPCISAMSRAEILEHLKEAHIEAAITAELDKLREQVLEELSRREAISKADRGERKKIKKKETPKKENQPKPNSGTGVRIIRM